MNYLSYTFKIIPCQPGGEILIAQLGDKGFESFEETTDGIVAYIPKKDWHRNILDNVNILDSNEFDIKYKSEEIEAINWNQEWEKNFNPIIVDGKCLVRAPFHKKQNTTYDIVIEPKMSFGTGHHETTHLMLQQLLSLNIANKTVLDMGCGTGVLAILSELRGAQSVDAIDIDNWCYLNCKENVNKNNCKAISVYEGDASLLFGRSYDIIIANINRNAILKDLTIYAESLSPKGVLLVSGFYKEDVPLIVKKCNSLNLDLVKTLTKNNWVSLKFESFNNNTTKP